MIIKKLYKIIIFILLSVIVVALFFGGKKEVALNSTTSMNVEKNSTSISIEEKKKTDVIVDYFVPTELGDLDMMLKKCHIRVLVLPSKVMYHVDKGKKTGVYYEMVREFEKNINTHYPSKKKHLKKHVIFVPISREEMIPALIEGRGDIAVGDLAITLKRKERIDFSDTYYHHVNEVIVTGPKSPHIQTIEDLSGKEVFVNDSSSYYEHLETINARFVKKGLAPIVLKSIPKELEDDDLLEMVNAGLIGITVTYEHKGELWSKVLKKIVLHKEIPIQRDLSFAWMIRKKSPLLMKEINRFMKSHKQGTLFGNILINRYTNKDRFVKYATSKKDLEQFQKVILLFKRYSTQYDLNYLLMIAQGYQESKLNQKKKSPVGAIGIMQLMPFTGKEMNVGDIKKVEQNIHAGHKYLRFLMDRYFKNEPMDELNKTLFAFASYNAGPARIRKLRKIAKERGLNPNIWFNSVEMIAAEKIGNETVTYVSNIFKYYVSYKLMKEQEESKDKARESLPVDTKTH